MNIFVLGENTLESAKAHCDKHVVKMIIESAQLLSTAVHFHGGLGKDEYVEGMYHATHYNHPCAVWTRACSGNYYWVRLLGQFLCDEYQYRYGKVHKSRPIFDKAKFYQDHIPPGLLQPFVFCGPEQYKHLPVVEAYREYYRNEKRSFAKWTRREQPSWF